MACFLAFISFNSFGHHRDYLYNSEAEGLAANIWRCLYQSQTDSVTFGVISEAMPFDSCLAVGKAKVEELLTVWAAAQQNPTACDPPMYHRQCAQGGTPRGRSGREPASYGYGRRT